MSYARTQECLEKYREKLLKSVEIWKRIKNEGVPDRTCQEIAALSLELGLKRPVKT